ncbi:MAG: exodeoxyribonuclease V subunit beta [Pseudomonadota bacterium]|nr:exodeoxyribonuclease V subunit beta [Pseudomonadota bacterium]
MPPLVLSELPLQGTHLIEASAGTGKTYTLAALYLRALLERELDVTQILVVTFTNAAAAELRERIRARLCSAQAALAGPPAADEEPVIAALRQRIAAADARRLLADALTRLDEAAIHTIHGYCHRVLQSRAFDSGEALETALVTDERLLRRDAVSDFWRRHCHGVSTEYADWLRSVWATPAELQRTLQDWPQRPDVQVLPALPPDTPQRLADELAARREAIARLWAEQGEAVRDLLSNDPALSRAAPTFNRDQIQQLLAKFETWLGGQIPLPGICERLSQTFIDAHCKRGKPPPRHALFAAMDEVVALAGELATARRVQVLTEAQAYLQRELPRRRDRLRQRGYDDLLRRLAEALAQPAGGAVLAAALRAAQPLAMIDEFQDTDPLQYGIFRRIYPEPPADVEAAHGLLLIGDPKQAIYRFRGADIYTYIAARRAIAPSRRHTLDSNWRSTPALVEAVNAIFGRAEQPFRSEDIPFTPVKARGPAGGRTLTLPGEPAALVVWPLSLTERSAVRGKTADGIRREAAYAQAFTACALEIRRLLEAAAAGTARLGERPLAASDIAVLVRTHHEAELLRARLAGHGLASVCHSRQSVLAAPEAQDLARVLAAIAAPQDIAGLRTALATPLLGLDAATLAAEQQDERAFERRIAQFQDYRARWQREGVLAMLHTLIREYDVAARLRSRPDGERALTDLLHLGELLQAASERVRGTAALLRWLAEARRDAGTAAAGEAAQLRLETDAQLIQIVTLHKSKGLEYPIVFLPTLWSDRNDRGGRDGKALVVAHDPQTLQPILDLGSAQRERHQALAAQAQLAEMVRLVYVGLTRAQHRLYLSWGPVADVTASGLASLLYPGEPAVPMDTVACQAPFEALARQAAGLVLAPLPNGAAEAPDRCPPPAPGHGPAPATAGARPPPRAVPQRWRQSSYSALALQAEPLFDLPDHAGEEATASGAEGGPPPGPSASPAAEAALDEIRAGFPRGPQPGSCLHALLETLPFAASASEIADTARPTLTRFGLASALAEPLGVWLAEALATPLPACGPAAPPPLAAVAPTARLNELAFHFPVDHLQPGALGALLRDYDLPSATRPLTFATVTGMIKGYVDLVFTHEARWYVADYKSNHLGGQWQDYRAGGLRAAVAAHRYDLQYLLYALALHRYLGQRLPDYRYETHFGGIHYLFLRGMSPAAPGCGVHAYRPEAALIERLDALMGPPP